MNSRLRDVGEELACGRVTSVELTTAALELARRRQQDVGAFEEITEEAALTAARLADAEMRAGGRRGPLHGVPVAVKDVIDVAGTMTRNGTGRLGHRRPRTDAAAWAPLRRAGAVLIGKTRTHELAWGMRTPLSRNPLDPSRTTGGSSGGSAAAVAAGIVPVALGTDTSGSVRNPAALCGVSGLKPTWGALPLEGVSPLAPSQDVVGVIATEPLDCLLVFCVATGRALSAPPAGGMRVGVLADRWATRVDDSVAQAMRSAVQALEGAGVGVPAAQVPVARLAPAVSFVVMLAESAAAWWPATLDAPGQVGDEVQALLRVGAEVRAMDYLRARQVAGLVRRAVLRCLDAGKLDALLLPTSPVTAGRADQDEYVVGGRAEPMGAAHARLTALASVTGLPAVSVPSGVGTDGMPVGVQLIGRPGAEAALCALGQVIDAGPGGRDVAALRLRRTVSVGPSARRP